MQKKFWLKADGEEEWDERKEYITASLEAGFDSVIVPSEDIETTETLGNIETISDSEDADFPLFEISNEEEVDQIISEVKDIEDRETVVKVEISGKGMEEAAVEAGEHTDYLIIIAQDWKVIPLENLIAQLQDAEANLIAGVKDAEEAKTALETSEVGSDRILLNPEAGVDEVKKTGNIQEEIGLEKFELVNAEITKVEPAGMGDRVCVDTSSLMNIGEGMLVGSQSDGLFLVHSETLESEYVDSRPFRVNAGAVHAYIQAPEGRTNYLSELESGDEVLIVNSKGEANTATVGRVKIEKRPMMLIEAEYDGEKYKTLLQNAETINLVNEDHEPVSVSDLEKGDKILLHPQEGGRHFGTKVKETLVER